MEGISYEIYVKKMMLSFCSFLLIFTAFSASAFAQSSSPASKPTDIIDIVKPYVEVTEDGLIQFKDVPDDVYENYNLDELQEHFNQLNELAQQNVIVMNTDLTIDKTAMTISTVYGTWTYYWWGYDRYFNNAQTYQAIDYYNTVAAGGAMVTGATAFLPPVAAFTGTTSGYFWLLATRMSANNNGNGVYAKVSWLAVFDIVPL